MKSYKLLYVEDFEPAAQTMQYVADELGYDCTCVLTPDAAMNAVAQDKFDLILIDVNMPEMDGDVLARQMRDHSQALLVGFTGEPSMLDKNRAAAFDGIEAKAFELDEVKKMLQSYLER